MASADWSDVEKAANAPIVLSRFGFKKIEIGGKKYLTPMTKEEAEQFVSSTRDPAKGQYTIDGGCLIDNGGGCHSQGCRGNCNAYFPPGSINAICICEPI
jgi:hypothetical protein